MEALISYHGALLRGAALPSTRGPRQGRSFACPGTRAHSSSPSSPLSAGAVGELWDGHGVVPIVGRSQRPWSPTQSRATCCQQGTGPLPPRASHAAGGPGAAETYLASSGRGCSSM